MKEAAAVVALLSRTDQCEWLITKFPFYSPEVVATAGLALTTCTVYLCVLMERGWESIMPRTKFLCFVSTEVLNYCTVPHFLCSYIHVLGSISNDPWISRSRFQPGGHVASWELLPSCLVPLHGHSHSAQELVPVPNIPQVAVTNYFRHSLGKLIHCKNIFLDES